MKINFSKVECCRLSDTTLGIDTFENKEKELVDFIQNDALDDQNKEIGTTWTWTYNKSICSRSWRKFPDLGTDLTYFKNISYFSRHDVNRYQ